MNSLDIDLMTRLPVPSDEEKHQRTLAALADVDEGRTIDHEEMMTWARSLFSQPNSAK